MLDQNTMFTITESMGGTLGEISLPSTIKDEPNEMVGQVLATRSPTCELRCGLENKLQTMLDTQSDAMEPEPSPTMEYSSDETILLTLPRPTPDSQNSQELPMALQDITPDQVDPCLQEVTLVNEHSVSMENDETSWQDVNDCSVLQDVVSPESRLQDITVSNDHSVSVENDETCSQDVNNHSNLQDVTSTELCLQDITASVHDANAGICSQDVNSVFSQEITDSQDISIISNEPYGQQDASISGLQHATNNSSVNPDLGNSQDVISICPEETSIHYDTIVSLEPQPALSNTSTRLTIKTDNEVTVRGDMIPPNTSSSDSVNLNSEALVPTVIEPYCRSSDDNTYESDAVNEIRNNTSVSVHETSVQEASIINTSMEAQVGDTVSMSMELPEQFAGGNIWREYV